MMMPITKNDIIISRLSYLLAPVAVNATHRQANETASSDGGHISSLGLARAGTTP
jgi:hypothetical protein